MGENGGKKYADQNQNKLPAYILPRERGRNDIGDDAVYNQKADVAVMHIDKGMNFLWKNVNVVHIQSMGEGCYQHECNVKTFVL